MEEAAICKECSEVYQEGARDPLLLPCGHTFCRSCVRTITETSESECPTCKKRHKKLHVKKMPAIHSLLNLSLTFKKNLYGVCSEHAEEQISFCCLQCKMALCKRCAKTQRHNGHQTQLVDDYIKNKKIEMGKNINLIDKKIIQIEDLNTRILGHMAQNIRQRSIFLQNTKTKITNLKADFEKAYRIDCLTNYETELNKIMQDLLPIQFQPNQVDYYVKAVQEVKEVFKTDQQCNKILNANKPVDRNAKLGYQDNRLLLHSFTPSVNSLLPIQMPIVVFLELSVGGQCLGRVYIQLQRDLDPTLHFLSHCLGTASHSYAGTSISMVKNDNVDFEAFAFEYCTKIGKDNWQQISTTGKKMGNNGTDPNIEGTMAVINHNSDEYKFCILIKGPSDYCRQPFGKVFSGLDVVRDAIHKNPNTKVTITDCGIVVDDLGN